MRRVLFTCLCCLVFIPSVYAEERYYAVLFASQDSSNQARWSHTFATFLKIDRDDDPRNGAQWESAQSVTISWMPASGSIRILQRPVAGRNYTLQESLAWAEQRGLYTTMRGPFEIDKDVYDRAIRQRNRLESGAIAWKALDRRFRPGAACNCIHAVSDVLPGPLLMTGKARGDGATAMIAAHFRPYLVDPNRTHGWALRHLELNGDLVLVKNGRRIGSTTEEVGE